MFRDGFNGDLVLENEIDDQENGRGDTEPDEKGYPFLASLIFRC
jgi:hypothetical protein